MKAASVVLIPLFLLSACGRDQAPTPASGQPAPAGTLAAEAVPADSNAAAPAAGKQGFDLQTLAVSDVPLRNVLYFIGALDLRVQALDASAMIDKAAIDGFLERLVAAVE